MADMDEGAHAMDEYAAASEDVQPLLNLQHEGSNPCHVLTDSALAGVLIVQLASQQSPLGEAS
jgi:hypothetical protein